MSTSSSPITSGIPTIIARTQNLQPNQILHFSCPKLFDEPTFTTEEKEQFRRFTIEVQRRIAQYGPDLSHLNMFNITQSSDIDTSLTPKDGLFMVALWVILLSELSKVMSLNQLKYPTFDSFRSTYISSTKFFTNEPIEEQHHLWHTANWMFILFKIIPAKKNKGLAMQVVPKMIEGWDVKYVTGSGQTKYTAYRVYIFETEGNTKAAHRGRSRSTSGSTASAMGKGKKRGVSGRPTKARRERSGSGDINFHPSKRRRRRASSISSTGSSTTTRIAAVGHQKKSVSFDMRENEGIESDGRVYVYNFIPGQERDNDEDDEEDFEEDFDEEDDDEEYEEEERVTTTKAKVTVSRTSTRITRKSGSEDAITDGDDQSVVNAEVCKVFTAFAEPILPSVPRGVVRDETTTLMPEVAELMRSESLLNFKVPSKERDISWSEIPVNSTTSTMRRNGSAPMLEFDSLFENASNGYGNFFMGSPVLSHSGISSPHTMLTGNNSNTMMYIGQLPGPSAAPSLGVASTTSSASLASYGGIAAVEPVAAAATTTNQFVTWWSTLQ